jgi:hypothetical protein
MKREEYNLEHCDAMVPRREFVIIFIDPAEPFYTMAYLSQLVRVDGGGDNYEFVYSIQENEYDLYNMKVGESFTAPRSRDCDDGLMTIIRTH